MATASNVDSFTKEERKLVIAALELKRASVVRAAKAASNDAVAAALQAEAAAIDTLIFRVR